MLIFASSSFERGNIVPVVDAVYNFEYIQQNVYSLILLRQMFASYPLHHTAHHFMCPFPILEQQMLSHASMATSLIVRVQRSADFKWLTSLALSHAAIG